MLAFAWFKHWDKVFWVFFLIMVCVVAFGGFSGLISFEFFILLGILLIVIGAGKLAEEISKHKIMGYQNDIYKKIYQLSQHLEKTFNVATMNKEKTEFRLQKLDQKRSEFEKRMEKRYREIAKKVIELENKINKLAKKIENK
jgi:DNA anti-recombination protein RmuC